MRSLPWWANVGGEMLLAFVMVGMGHAVAFFNGESLPGWAAFPLAMLGIIMWNRPTYNQRHHFDK